MRFGPLLYPVFLSPAAMPLMVAAMARCRESLVSPARLRRSSSTWIRLIGIDVGISDSNGTRQHRIGFQQNFLPGHGKHRAARAFIFRFQTSEDTISQCAILRQQRILSGDVEVGLGQRQFHVANEVNEHGKLPHHVLQDGKISLFDGMLQGMADAEPSGNAVAALHPSKHPGNGAKVGEIAFCFAAHGTRTDARKFQLIHRRGFGEILQDLFIFRNISAIETRRRVVESSSQTSSQPGIISPVR